MERTTVNCDSSWLDSLAKDNKYFRKDTRGLENGLDVDSISPEGSDTRWPDMLDLEPAEELDLNKSIH